MSLSLKSLCDENGRITCCVCNICYQWPHGNFTKHVRRIHNISIQQYYIKYVLCDIVRLCKCGCGLLAPTTWYACGSFCDYISGHNTPKKIKLQKIPKIKKSKQPKIVNTCKERNPKTNRLRTTLEEIKRQIFEKHGDTVTIVDETFRDPKPTFIDKDFGSWTSRLDHIQNGHQHPKRGKQIGINKIKASSDVASIKRKQTCIKKFGYECVFQSPIIKNKAKQTCIKRYGTENPMQCKEVFNKNKSLQKNVRKLFHWKTNDELICTAGYEYAVVKWLNFFKIDFDWQIPYLMPDGHKYFVDLYIKDGVYKNTWVEIKGFWYRKSEKVSREKWELFHSLCPNSELWMKDKLNELNILIDRTPNPLYEGIV